VRVGREAAPGVAQFPAEVPELGLGETPLQECARVDAGGGVALEVDQVAARGIVLPPEEVVEADLVQSGGRGVGGDVPPDAALFPVGPNHHGHGIPAEDALHAPLDLPVSRESGLGMPGNGVQVRGVGGVGKGDPELGRPALELAQEPADPVGAPGLDDVIEGLEPLRRLEALEAGVGRLRVM